MSENIDFNFPDPTSFKDLPKEVEEIENMIFPEGNISWQRTWDDIMTLTEGMIIVLKLEQKKLGL